MGQKSIKKNMLMSVILTAANFVYPLITFSYVARVLTPSGTGKVAFVHSVLSYFSYIAILGIPAYGLREAAKLRDHKDKMSHLVQELFIINFISTLIAYICLAIAVIAVPKLFADKSLFLIMGSMIFLNTIGLEWVYQAIEEYSYITIRSLVFKTIAVALTFILIKTDQDYLWYGFLTIFTNSASYVLNFFNIRKHVSLKIISPLRLKRHLKPIFTLFAASIIITIYANFDVIMLGLISSEYEVGLYNSAQKIKAFVLSLSTAVTTVLVPRISYYVENGDSRQIEELVKKSLRVSLDVAIPVAVYVFLFSTNCLKLLCGNEYIDASGALKILIACVVPLVLTNLFGNQLLIPLGKEKIYSQSVFVGMWINIGLNALLIPTYGVIGAAAATLAAESWNVFWMSRGVTNYRNVLIKTINYWVYVVGFLIASCLSLSIYHFIKVPVILQIGITAMAFFTCYYLILYLFKEPIIIGMLLNIRSRIHRNG